jgi:[acyl-carrier-protein] S-malonyltransferase
MLNRLLFRGLRTSAIRRTDTKDKPKSPIVQELLDNAATFEDLKPASEEEKWATLPYVEGTHFPKGEEVIPSKTVIDPRETSVIMFPGQGAQFVGMGANLLKFPGARDIYELANQVLGYDLLRICIEGPKEKLDQTIYCQPAVLVTSLASLEKLKEERPRAIDNCVATAGFSLGELTALIFAGAIPFDKGLRLVQVRAEAMQMASERAKGGMATVLYAPDSDIKKACSDAMTWCIERGIEEPDCRVANYLFPHCKVIAGNVEALEFIEKNLKNYRLKRFKRLPVSGAFHTNLMEPAVEPFQKALKKIQIEEPIISVHSNVDGLRYRNVGHILKQLPKQIVRPVKWEQTIHHIYGRKQGEHFPRTFECGPGNGLKTILQKVNAKAWDTSFSISV